MSVTDDERKEMCELLDELGPEQPTLCGDWTTNDLIVHLVVRERRPDAAAGIVLRPLQPHMDKVTNELARKPFTENVDTFRNGPPWWTIWAVPKVGDRLNLFEMYVHHEDVRRAQPDWDPRPHDPAREDALWSGLTSPISRMLFRKCDVGVVLRAAGREDHVVKKGEPAVHLVGEPSEIALIAFGRPSELSRVVVQGDPGAVARFEASPRGV